MNELFLDVGDGTGILKKKVVLILNADTASVQSTTRKFLRRMSEKGESVLPKKPLKQVNALILTNSYGQDSLYSSSRRASSLAGKEKK